MKKYRDIFFSSLVSIVFLNLAVPQCDECQEVWSDSYWGEQCCDVAWEQWGFDCTYMENEYGWDCTGCECPYDNNAACGDGSCNADENIENCSIDCTENGCNTSNQVDDCSDEDCCSSSWIGDGYADCEDPNNFGCDLSCYNNDGGDCPSNILGDINSDLILDILDIILIINLILNGEYDDSGDVDINEILNILDIIQLINIILSNLTIEKIQEETGCSYQCYPNEIGQFPVVLYNHGGLGQSVGGDLFNTCKSLAENGYLARSEKREETISLEGHLEEVLIALNNLKNHEKAHENKIGLIGFSRGGLLSLHASILDDDVNALVLLAPATGNGLLYNLFESFNEIDSSVLIQIAENDNSPDNLIDVSYEIYDVMLQNNIDVSIIEYPPYDSNFDGLINGNDDGHQLFFIVQDPYWSDLINFLNQTFDY